jgi:hypothetical protein
MRLIKWLGIASALVLIVACFMDWVFIESKGLALSGIDTTGTNFGSPAYLHFGLIFLFIVFSLVPRVWAKRANLLAGALNLAWALRNYLLITGCSGGECPTKRAGLYLVLGASIVMLVATLFPDIKLKTQPK